MTNQDRGWTSEDLAEYFDGVSTVEMLRVARMTVNEYNTYHWAATTPGVSWAYANGSWTSTNDKDERFGRHDFDEDFFRYLLGEQLIAEGVRRDSPHWQRY